MNGRGGSFGPRRLIKPPAIYVLGRRFSLVMHRLFLVLLAALAFSAATYAAQPDILVILTDQWSPRYLSWDNPQARTPALDQIAKEGMIFDACYTPSPVCMPARISLGTGLYPHNQCHAL